MYSIFTFPGKKKKKKNTVYNQWSLMSSDVPYIIIFKSVSIYTKDTTGVYTEREVHFGTFLFLRACGLICAE